ncbi:MAG: AraC family transcriptional regulator [Candidatus Hydrogenedentota bacterium]|nr:MAG: AraC family transcriptional regulator [Candidatus Hydrogenedentota bacterium]
MNPTFREFLTQFIFAGASLAFFLSLAFFFLKRKTISHYFLFTLLLVITGTLLFAWFNIREIYFRPLWVNYLFIPLNFFIGPSVYFFFFTAVKNGYSVDIKKLYTYVPGIVVLILLPIFSALGLLHEKVTAYFEQGEIGLADILLVSAFLYNHVFYFLIFKHGAIVFDFHSLQSATVARLFFSLFIVVGLINIYGIFAFALKNLTLMYVGAAFIALLVVMFFLFSYRYPEFFALLETLIDHRRTEKLQKKPKKKKSSLEGINLKELHLDLVELMNNEKLYMEEDLTLARVADELGIKPYQLSEFLNSHLGINFAQFVNRFRIEKAKQLLLQEENTSVLSVAFKVGFNSKANFNLLFSTYVGKTPTQFIKEKKAKKS